jgi:uncharacterized protein (TIGR03435 family)
MRGCLVFAVFTVLPGFCQPVDPRPAFELASIRPCEKTVPGAALSVSPGRLSLPCWPVHRLVWEAYRIYADGTNAFMIQPPAFMQDVPQMSSDMYSIEAKANSPRSMAMMRSPMMQRLLEERFHLRMHRETREVPVYLATVGRDGHTLKATAPGSCDDTEVNDIAGFLAEPSTSKPHCGILTPPKRNGSHYVMDEHGISLAAFFKVFNIGGLPLIDNTGVTGTFDIHFEWDYSPAEGDGPPDLSIVSSFRRQLGLELHAGKGPREFFVVDHVERPTEN